MAETFKVKCVDWDKFTAEDALAYTKEAQIDLQRQEYISIIKEIARVAKLGQSEIIFSKKLTDYTISKLKDNGFDIIVEKKLQAIVTVTGCDSSIKDDYWTTTIKW